MRRRVGSFVPGRHKPLRMGRPKVREDVELYEIIASFAQDVKDGKDLREMSDHIRSWCRPWEDWQLAIMAMRGRLFVGSIRRVLGERSKLDPNQLRLLKGI